MADIMPFPMHALEGHDHSLTLWRRGDESLLLMNGRFHLYQGYTAAEVVAPVRLAALLGAEMMLATNASKSATCSGITWNQIIAMRVWKISPSAPFGRRLTGSGIT